MALTPSQLKSATKYNYDSAEKVGWMPHYEQVLGLLGFTNISPLPEQFAEALAEWQEKRKLTADGKLGPTTWKNMKPSLGLGPKPSPINTSLDIAGIGPLWLQVAQAEKNRWETAMAGMTKDERKIAEFHMTRDEEYFMASPYFGAKVKNQGTVPKNKSRLDWCAAFTNWCLHRAGVSHSGSAGANSFTRASLWRFNGLKEPKPGCVIVVGYSKGGHVGFMWDWEKLPNDPKGDVSLGKGGRKLFLLGGNQSQTVCIKRQRSDLKMLAARGQNGVLSPYMWPVVGTPNCNHLPGTEQGHFCGKIH